MISTTYIKTPNDPTGIDQKRLELFLLMSKSTKIQSKYVKPDFTIPGGRKLALDETEKIHYEEIFSPDFLKEIEDLFDRIYQDMDLWLERVLHKDILNEFKDTYPMWQYNICYLPFWLLDFLCGMLLYQRRVGGSKLIDGLNKIIPIGDRVLDLCLHLLTQKEHSHIMQMWKAKYENDYCQNCWGIKKAAILAVVGDKKRTLETLRSSVSSSYTEVSHKVNGKTKTKYKSVDASKYPDEVLWRSFTQSGNSNLFGFGKVKKACICCGILENKKSGLHNICSACGNAFYCSKDCQVKHWKVHKQDCKKHSKKTK